MVPPDPRLDVAFQFVKRDAHAFTVRFAYSLIASDKSSKRNGFRSRKRGVPACSVLHRLDGVTVLVFVFVRHAVLNKLLTCLRVLALAQLGEIFRTHRTDQAILRGQAALPLALDSIASRPVALFLGGEF